MKAGFCKCAWGEFRAERPLERVAGPEHAKQGAAPQLRPPRVIVRNESSGVGEPGHGTVKRHARTIPHPLRRGVTFFVPTLITGRYQRWATNRALSGVNHG